MSSSKIITTSKTKDFESGIPSKSDILNVGKHVPHYHIIVEGTGPEVDAILQSGTPAFIRSMAYLSNNMDDSRFDMKKGTVADIVHLLRSNEDNGQRVIKIRDLAGSRQTGGDLRSVAQSVGKFALQLAPAILPLIL